MSVFVVANSTNLRMVPPLRRLILAVGMSLLVVMAPETMNQKKRASSHKKYKKDRQQPIRHLLLEITTPLLPQDKTQSKAILSTCSRCNKTKTESIPIISHRWVEFSRIPSTCLPGSVVYTCSMCKKTKTESIPANPAAHTWTETFRPPATCLPGTINYTCSICNQTKTV